jgi:hypothetical protein
MALFASLGPLFRTDSGLIPDSVPMALSGSFKENAQSHLSYTCHRAIARLLFRTKDRIWHY